MKLSSFLLLAAERAQLLQSDLVELAEQSAEFARLPLEVRENIVRAAHLASDAGHLLTNAARVACGGQGS